LRSEELALLPSDDDFRDREPDVRKSISLQRGVSCEPEDDIDIALSSQ
jgi:hypothetical protein